MTPERLEEIRHYIQDRRSFYRHFPDLKKLFGILEAELLAEVDRLTRDNRELRERVSEWRTRGQCFPGDTRADA